MISRAPTTGIGDRGFGAVVLVALRIVDAVSVRDLVEEEARHR
jgi:hypothetical protein